MRSSRSVRGSIWTRCVKLAASVSIAAAAAAQNLPSAEWLPVWMEASAKAKQLASALRNFTCLQDIQRTTPSRDGRLISDFLRLEVGIVNGREAYGWPGGVLEATSPAELAAFGVFGTGDFYAHLKSLVADREGRVVSAKRSANDLWEFEVSVGRLESSFSFGGAAGKATVPYNARVAIGSADGLVRRIAIDVPEVPLGFRSKSASFVLTYDPASLFAGIPERSVARISNWTEPDVIMESHWRQCSSFSVESRFLESEETATTSGAVPSQWTAVKSARIHTRLKSPVAVSGVGTTVPMTLIRPVELANSSTLPAGTTIAARLVALTSLDGFPGRLAALRLESYIAPGVRVAFRARAVTVTGSQARSDLRRTAQTVYMGRIDRSTGVRTTDTQLLLLGNHDDALISLREGENSLYPPLEIVWETVKAKP